MTETPNPPGLTELPEAADAPQAKWSLQLVWLVPLVAIAIGGWLAVKSIMDRGPTITISFLTAEGIEAGKTTITYKNVQVGQVSAVHLSPDLKRVTVTAELVKDFGPHLREDTRFWLVRPRISGGSVSGLGTLVSGAYIAVNVGSSTAKRRDFVALEIPPVVDMDVPGREFVLHEKSAGSATVGAPVYYREMQAGQILSYALDPDGQGVSVRIFIYQDYLKYVTGNTRFWNASGLDVTLDANGIRMDIPSIVSVLIGGISFETPFDGVAVASEPPPEGFVVFASRVEAMKNPEADFLPFVAVFDESVRGLSPGAPVEFRGVRIGEVVAIDFDTQSSRLLVPVTVKLYPQRIYARAVRKTGMKSLEGRRRIMDQLVAQGLRASLRTGNLLTGQRYVSLDFVPNAKKAAVDWASSPPELPTQKGGLEELQTSLSSIASKIDKMPLEQIGADVHLTLQSANKLLARLDAEVAPEARDTLAEARRVLASADRAMAADSPLQQSTQGALNELGEAARALRVLADYLERHPESLIRGKPEDDK